MLDALLKQTIALPAAAGAVYTTPAVDLSGQTARGMSPGKCDWIVSAPVLTNAELPAGITATYAIEHDDALDFGTVTTYANQVIVQTGAGAGAAAVVARVGLAPSNAKRYWRLKVTTSAGAGDCSAKEASLQLHVVADGPDLRQ